MDKREQKIIVVSAMHGRHATVKYCLNKLEALGLDVYMAYSNAQDGLFLTQFDNVKKITHVSNQPLANKWNVALQAVKYVDFDAVILLGSDDYIDANFLDFIKAKIQYYEMIAFTDMYFKKGKAKYYWSGYTNHRQGEPAGAGKTYTKEFLKRINFDLFGGAVDRGLDGVSWNKCLKYGVKKLVTSMKKQDIICCDVKDGQGMTKLKFIPNLMQI